MPSYLITSPDGRKFRINTPEGVTKEQAFEVFKQQAGAQPDRRAMLEAKHGAALPEADATGSFLQNLGAGTGKAVVDTGRGLAQLGMAAADLVPGVNLTDQREAYRQQIDEAQQRDRQLMGTGGGVVGNIVGNVAMLAAPGGAVAGVGRLAQAPRLIQTAQGAQMVRPLVQAGARMALPQTVRGAIAQGTVAGAVQPTGTEDSAVWQTGVGGVAGLVGGALPRVIGGAIRGAGAAVSPFTQSGAQNIAGRVVQRFTSDPANLANMQIASGVPGVQRTLAEASQDVGLGQLQRSVSDMDPQAAGRLVAQREANQAARRAVLEGLAGDEAAMAAARTARDNAAMGALRTAVANDSADVRYVVRGIDRILASPSGKRDTVVSALGSVRTKLLDDYTPEMRITDARSTLDDAITNRGRMSGADFDMLREARRLIRTNAVDAADAAKVLGRMRPKSKAATAAIDAAKATLRAPDKRGVSDVGQLYGVRKHIDDLLAGRAAGDNAAAKAARRELMAVKNSLDRAITKAAPEFGDYLRLYREGSRPINQMEVGQELLRRATMGRQETGQIFPARLETAMSNLDDVAAAGTGFRRAQAGQILDAPQMNRLNALLEDTLRARNADTRGRALGSNTLQNLAGNNMLSETLRPAGLTNADGILSLISAFTGRGPMGNALGKLYTFAGAETGVRDALVEMMQNPQLAQQVLARLPPAQRVLIEQQLSRLAAPAGVALSMAEE